MHTKSNLPRPYDAAIETDVQQRDPFVLFVRRWWWLLVIGAILGAVGAVVFLQRGPITYQTSALVQISAIDPSNPTADARAARTATINYIGAASSPRIFGLVSQALSTQPNMSTDILLQMHRDGDIVIRQNSGANFISFAVKDTDGARAKLIADTFATVFVKDVNDQAKASQQQQQQALQQQINFARQQLAAGSLFQQQQDLENKIQSERSALLNLQSDYQRDLLIQPGNGLTPSSADAITLAASLNQAVTDQVKQVVADVNSLTSQLQDVNNQIAKLPAGTDRSLVTAYATAYSAELSSLTQTYVEGQINALSAAPPLISYGEAPPAFRATSRKKLLSFGMAGGVALAVGLAFLFDLLRKRKAASRLRAKTRKQLELAPLMRTLENFGVIEPLEDSGPSMLQTPT